MISEDLGSLPLLQDHINVAGVGPDHTSATHPRSGRAYESGPTCCDFSVGRPIHEQALLAQNLINLKHPETH